MPMVKILALIFILIFASPAFAATRTVDAAGGGDHLTIQACADVAVAGDTCLISAGTYTENVVLPTDGGPGSYITFKGATSVKPIVSGSIDVQSRDYIIIDGLEITGGIHSHPSGGNNSTNIKITNNYFNCTGVTIGDAVINIRGSDCLISGNVFVGNTVDVTRTFGPRFVIRNNVVTDTYEGTGIHLDFWQSFCSSATGITGKFTLIEGNTMIRVFGSDVHFGLINGTLECADPFSNLIFRYNKIHYIGSMAVYIDTNQQVAGVSRNVVYNNTFSYLQNGVFTWEDGNCILTGSTNSSTVNNLNATSMDITNAVGAYFAAGGYQAYNLYYSDSGTMTFAGDAAAETGAVKNQNPLLLGPSVNNFGLHTSSPARDTGGPLTTVAAADTSSGVDLVVTDAAFFQPGWGGADADWIAVGTVGNIIQISSIDYDTNTITITASIPRSDGDAVWLYKKSDGERVLYGSAPDIGAHEYNVDFWEGTAKQLSAGSKPITTGTKTMRGL